jgi:hypothetical protein
VTADPGVPTSGLIIISDTATTVLTQVPTGATRELVTVTTPAGTATTKTDFVVTS